MKRRKIACLSMALIITTLLTGCSLGDIPVVGKFFDKGADAPVDAPVADDQGGAADASDVAADTPQIDAEYPPVPVGTVITIDDIFNVLSSVGLSTETVAGYLILDASGNEADELTITEDTYFTFIYQMRDADASEQSQMVIGVKVTDEVAVETPAVGEPTDGTTTDGTVADGTGQDSTSDAAPTPTATQKPAAAKYEVFDYTEVECADFDFSALESGKVYKNSITNFDVHKVVHNYEYETIAKNISELVDHYTDSESTVKDKFMVYCIPISYVYMQAPDYEEGADMSAYSGEYVLVLEPVYSDYTDSIYRREETLLLPVIDDVNEFAKEPSDEAKAECDFLLSEEFDDESTEIDDFYGAEEILMQLADTEDIFLFDDILKTKVVDYSDMGTPDNMTDDVTWEDYEAGVISEAQASPTPSATPSSEGTGDTSSTETTTTTTTSVTETTTTTTTSPIQAINEEVANSFRSRHPELFTFFPESDQIYSKWDWRIDDNTTVKGTVTLKDGTIIPQLERSESGVVYDITKGTSSTSGSTSAFGGGSSTGSVFGGGSSQEDSDEGSGTSTTTVSTGDSGSATTVGDEGYQTSDPVGDDTGDSEGEDSEDDGTVQEYEIALGDTKCKVMANNTYRYMIDNQNSSSSEVYINHRDKRYTIKIVDEDEYMNYWTKDHLNRSMNGYSITASDYTGSTVADNTSIVLMNIIYEKDGNKEYTEPYMAYIRNGSEYIIIIPDGAEEPNSDVLADILKRCVAMQ